MTPSKVVGVLGGMGPAATWAFCDEVRAATPVTREDEHVRLLVDSDPSVPSRPDAILRGGPSPGPHLARMARGLEASGAEVLCMACNTAHAFSDAIRAATERPFVDMIDATVRATVAAAPAARSVGVLATEATMASGLYREAFGTRGWDVLDLPPALQQRVTELILAVKAGEELRDLRAAAVAVAAACIDEGADVLVAGCTELPLVLQEQDVAVPLVSSTRALAEAVVAVAWAGREVT